MFYIDILKGIVVTSGQQLGVKHCDPLSPYCSVVTRLNPELTCEI